MTNLYQTITPCRHNFQIYIQLLQKYYGTEWSSSLKIRKLFEHIIKRDKNNVKAITYLGLVLQTCFGTDRSKLDEGYIID